MLRFLDGEVMEISAGASIPPDGVIWLDLVGGESGWRSQLPPGLRLSLHAGHESDILNTGHPPFFNQTRDYQFLIFRTYDQASEPTQPGTRPIAFVMQENLLVTIRDASDQSFSSLPGRWSSGELSVPDSVDSLLHRLLDEVVDRLMGLRQPVNQLLTQWQEHLLDPKNTFDDWRQLMRMRKGLRGLSDTMYAQLNVLEAWREENDASLGENLEIRFNDLEEHIKRVADYTDQNQAAIDALVQIHFAANGQRTNQVMQFLAAISAIFLPLNLLVGFFGMNFVDMPFVNLPWAGVSIALFMFVTMAILLWWFRIRRWI